MLSAKKKDEKLSSLVFNPAMQAFPPSHLGKVCKHTMLSLRCVGSSLVYFTATASISTFAPKGKAATS